ncbi:hypothetical protein RESH_00007 [Rhodopirellula europaea SH398]|uniref:Uncharacterized protein n=1 Tax=Rhodopirellula europaea SH398 TaxID=1263868 RepID=M5SNR0_9BACT|nr:hypothetical protein RESH_00007 [Rhodopirellula europaea SH398]
MNEWKAMWHFVARFQGSEHDEIALSPQTVLIRAVRRSGPKPFSAPF